MTSQPTDSVPDSPAPATGGRRLFRLGTALAAAVAVFAAALLGTNFLVHRLARPHIHWNASDVAAPFAIVPGASVHRDGTPSPQLEDRLAAALALMRAGRVRRVLVSGARDGAYDEAGPMRRWLIQRGVRATDIIEDHAGFRTLDTMARAAQVFGVREAVVCTQSFHLPRAVFLARRAGIDATGLIAGPDTSRRSTTADQVRESLASFIAVIDSYLLHRRPRRPTGSLSAGSPPEFRDTARRKRG